jgi:glycosyltransferase involved in cell wall biosynthesis
MSVAVIIPTFQRPDALARALRSVFRQTLPPHQVVVVDDGSGDHTPEVVRRFPAVTFVQQANAGPAAARNRGLREVTSKFVASLDHDDEWDADFLFRSVDALERHSADVAWLNFRQTGTYTFGDYLKTDHAASRLLRSKKVDAVVLDEKGAREFFLFTGGAVSNSALVFRRNSLGEGWDKATQVADDLLVLARLLFNGPLRYAFLTTPLWTKHEHESNLSRDSESTVRRCLHDFGVVSRRGASSFSVRDRRRWQRKMGNLHYKLAYHCFWNTGFKAAWREATQAFAEAGATTYGLRLLVIASLRKCARLVGIPPLSQLRRKHGSPRLSQQVVNPH